MIPGIPGVNFLASLLRQGLAGKGKLDFDPWRSIRDACMVAARYPDFGIRGGRWE
jgi:hypothetical protein